MLYSVVLYFGGHQYFHLLYHTANITKFCSIKFGINECKPVYVTTIICSLSHFWVYQIIELILQTASCDMFCPLISVI